MPIHLCRRRRCDRGETLIEFAIVLAVSLATVLGTMQFGLMVFRYNMLSDLAQEGARRASVCGANSGLSITDCDIVAFVRARSLGINPSVTVTPNPSTLVAGQPVRVEVRHTFNPLTGLIPVGPLTFSSSATMFTAR